MIPGNRMRERGVVRYGGARHGTACFGKAGSGTAWIEGRFGAPSLFDVILTTPAKAIIFIHR